MSENNIKILNEFGIVPTNTFVSAGADFYIPNITKDKQETAFNAFSKSYNVSIEDINEIISGISFNLNIEFNIFDSQIVNIVHLYLGLDSYELENISNDRANSDRIKYFVENYLIFDKNNIAGLQLKTLDQVLINSGIRVALNHNTAGVFFNKSGKGNAGFDIRACVVDEDYTGFVHLSLQYSRRYTENTKHKAQIFCGDKLSQMLILPINRMNAIEISADEYYTIMANSKRGANAFGHSDVKH